MGHWHQHFVQRISKILLVEDISLLKLRRAHHWKRLRSAWGKIYIYALNMRDGFVPQSATMIAALCPTCVTTDTITQSHNLYFQPSYPAAFKNNTRCLWCVWWAKVGMAFVKSFISQKKEWRKNFWVLISSWFALSDINKHGQWTSLDTKLAESTILIHITFGWHIDIIYALWAYDTDVNTLFVWKNNTSAGSLILLSLKQ